MPLYSGKGRGIFKKNLKTLLNEGRPKDQALAIAYSKQKEKKKKDKK